MCPSSVWQHSVLCVYLCKRSSKNRLETCFFLSIRPLERTSCKVLTSRSRLMYHESNVFFCNVLSEFTVKVAQSAVSSKNEVYLPSGQAHTLLSQVLSCYRMKQCMLRHRYDAPYSLFLSCVLDMWPARPATVHGNLAHDFSLSLSSSISLNIGRLCQGLEDIISLSTARNCVIRVVV